MSVRFRIRTPGGQELSFASVDMFEDFVRSGDLSEDDLVYDAEDGSWAPARTHPIVLNIQYEEEEAAEQAASAESGETDTDDADERPEDDASDEPSADDVSDGPPAVDASDAPDSGDDLGLSLAPPREPHEEEDEAEGSAAAADDGSMDMSMGLELAVVEEVSADDARRQFLEKLEAERAQEREFGMEGGVTGFRMETSGSMADLVAPEPEVPAVPPERSPESRAPAPRPEPRPRAASGGGAGILLGIVALLVLGGGAYFGFRAVTSGGEDQPSAVPDVPVEAIPVETVPEPEPEPVIARTQAAVLARARERFLTATQTALRNLPPIPDSWPSGPYLALPSAHPDVLGAWEEYLATARRVRAADVERFRSAYELALDDALIEGEERTTRLQGALTAFEASAEARAAHYDRVEALASAAIQSHNALVDSEGLLIFDGTGEGIPAGSIGAGVSARDEDSVLLLQQVSELLTAVLEADGLGPGSGENVRAWVWDGFLDAVTN